MGKGKFKKSKSNPIPNIKTIRYKVFYPGYLLSLKKRDGTYYLEIEIKCINCPHTRKICFHAKDFLRDMKIFMKNTREAIEEDEKKEDESSSDEKTK
mgnify:FL=1